MKAVLHVACAGVERNDAGDFMVKLAVRFLGSEIRCGALLKLGATMPVVMLPPAVALGPRVIQRMLDVAAHALATVRALATDTTPPPPFRPRR